MLLHNHAAAAAAAARAMSASAQRHPRLTKRPPVRRTEESNST